MGDQPLGERVARQEAMMEGISADVREIRDEIRSLRRLLDERLEEMDERITALERWRAWVLGAAAAVGFAADAFWRWLSRQGG